MVRNCDSRSVSRGLTEGGFKRAIRFRFLGIAAASAVRIRAVPWPDERYRIGWSPASAATDVGANERARVPVVQARGLVPAPCVFLDCPARHPVIRCRVGGCEQLGLPVTTTATSAISRRRPPAQCPLADRFSQAGRPPHQMRDVVGCVGSRMATGKRLR